MVYDDQKFSLADLTSALRSEINEMRSKLEQEGQAALLLLERAEVEISFVIEKKQESGGGVKFSVLGIGANVSGQDVANSATTQKLKIVLVPKNGDLPGVAGGSPA